jgi:hypothetical protein
VGDPPHDILGLTLDLKDRPASPGATSAAALQLQDEIIRTLGLQDIFGTNQS